MAVLDHIRNFYKLFLLILFMIKVIKEEIKDKWFYLPITILFLHFLYRLVDQSKMIWQFPLDKFNDWSSYLAQLYFLKVCGFHNFCSYWYNGFISFQISQPGWYFFIYPFYLLTNNVQLTGYLSLIITFALSFIALYIAGKKLGLSKIKVVAFFIFFFGNAVAIGNFIRLGKIHELFGWFNLIVIFLFLIFYKDRKLNGYFIFIIPFYFFAILSHQNSAIISTLAFIGFFLIKNIKEKFIVILSMLVAILSSSFWWFYYLMNFFSTNSTTIIVANSLRKITMATLNDNIVAVVVPLLFFTILYFYIKSVENKRNELIFFLPQIIIAFLILTRLILFVPFLRQVFPDSYNLFLLFFSLFMFFKVDYGLLGKYKTYIKHILVAVAIISVVLNILFTIRFIEYTPLEEETISLFPYVEGRFILLASSSRTTSYPEAYYAYAAIYHNLSSSSGWYHSAAKAGYMDRVRELDKFIKDEKCNELKYRLKELNTTEVITYDEHCNFLNECGFNRKINKSRVCLYSLL